MEHVTVDTEWYLVEPEETDGEVAYVEPQGMVDVALKELGAQIVAVDLQLPDPA
jgi:hypothetical protein